MSLNRVLIEEMSWNRFERSVGGDMMYGNCGGMLGEKLFIFHDGL